MSRTLTITATEVPAVQTALATDGTLWLVAPAMKRLDATSGKFEWLPPVEFVQACAPCETCKDERGQVTRWTQEWRPCPDCRIELVSPCLLCGGSGRTLGGPLGEDVGDCRCAMTEGLIVFGHAYAVGSPLPIIRGWARPDGDSSGDVLSVWKGHYGPDLVMQRAWNATAIQTQYADRTAALAHYGPSESLVGKWAIELRVVGS